MSDLLHHSKEINIMTEQYLKDTDEIIIKSLTTLRKSKAFTLIYKTSLAVEAVLLKLSNRRMNPSLNTLRSINLRIPLLVAIGQSSVAMVELRRFMELCCWSIYFTDHPIEWAYFTSNPNRSFKNNIDNPISYCAHRGFSFYSNYVLV
jgi:hypothetical protein